MRRCQIGVVKIGLWVLILAVPLQAGEDRIASRFGALRAEAVERLHALAGWCTSAKLFGARAEVYEGILRFDPDDAVARKWLKFRRDKQGQWVRRGTWKKPKNLSKSVDTFRAKREALGVWIEGRLTPLRDEAEADGAHRLEADMTALALGADPERRTFRAWNREVPGPKRGWILEETQQAGSRRAGIREAARKALAAVPTTKPGTEVKDDLHGRVRWKTVRSAARVRIVATTDAPEVEQIARNVEACWPVIRYAVGRAAPAFRGRGRYAGAGLTVYVFDDVPMANAFYAAQPGTTPRSVAFTAPLVGTWLPNRPAQLVKSALPATRFEAASKGVLASLDRSLLGLGRTRAWAAEGLALYLNYQIVGTRRIYSVNDVQTKYADPAQPVPEYEKRMSDSTANWLDLGRLLLESKDKPDLFLMSGKDFNGLTRPEILYGYCFAAYVVEGWPDKAAAFFQAVSSDHGTDLDRVCLETFRHDARSMERRLGRWLDETADLP